MTECGRFLWLWNGEYEGTCRLPLGHDGDHWDGLTWFNDRDEITEVANQLNGAQLNDQQ